MNPSAEYLRNRPIERPMTSDHSSCPCQGPQCRSSDSTPPMPVPAQITADDGLMLLAHGQVTAETLFGNTCLDDCSMYSEAHSLSPDPPPRSLS